MMICEVHIIEQQHNDIKKISPRVSILINCATTTEHVLSLCQLVIELIPITHSLTHSLTCYLIYNKYIVPIFCILVSCCLHCAKIHYIELCVGGKGKRHKVHFQANSTYCTNTALFAHVVYTNGSHL